MKDLKIRQLSRPTVVKDNKLGYNSIERKYVVQGDKVVVEGIFSNPNTPFISKHPTGESHIDTIPLFLDVGTEDEEYTNFFLVDQKITPSPDTVDKAFLTRTFVEIRDTWISETVTQTNDLQKITRSYVVLRKEHPKGYLDVDFKKHPTQNGYLKSSEAWDYLPIIVKATKPTNSHDSVITASSSPIDLVNPTVNSIPLYTAVSGDDGVVSEYLESSVKVDISNPGVDFWTVSWVAPLDGYWATATTSKSAASMDLPMIVEFDENGLKLMDWGDSGSGSVAAQAWQYVFYHVGETLPKNLIRYMGGSGSSTHPSVNLDFYFSSYEGTSRSHTFQRLIKNAIFKKPNTAILRFPKSDGTGNVEVASTRGTTRGYIFKYDCGNSAPVLYQNSPISRAGGRLDWGSTVITSGWNNATRISTKIAPIASHRGRRVWKIAMTFVS